MNNPEPTAPAGDMAAAAKSAAERDAELLAKMQAKLAARDAEPPAAIATTDEIRPDHRWTAVQWAERKRRRKSAAASRRRNRR